MLKKVLTVTLVALLFNASLLQVAAASPLTKEARFAEKVKAGIAKLGTGTDARVELRLRDKTKVKGYIKEAGEDGFTVVDEKTGSESLIAYPQVGQVKGNNLSTTVKIVITIGLMVFLLALLARNNT
jgi:hypothetical protein